MRLDIGVTGQRALGAVGAVLLYRLSATAPAAIPPIATPAAISS